MKSTGHSLNANQISRDVSIDRLRGLLVVLMVAGDYLGGVNWIPGFLKHAPDIGFTIADVVAPVFVFVIGLNFAPSFNRHLSEGRVAGYRYFITRYLSLIGIGAIITAGASLVGKSTGWGVLEALGVAGLITLVFIKLPTWARFVVGTALLCGYQYVLETQMLHSVLTSGHGGLFGAIAWSALLLLSTAVADVWRKGIMPYLICSASLIATAIISLFVIPVSKNRVSLSYVLLTLAISAVTFLIFKIISDSKISKAGLLTWWGKNSLAMYMLHLLVLAIFSLPALNWWYADVPLWLLVLQLVSILSFMSAVAWSMQSRSNAARAD